MNPEQLHQWTSAASSYLYAAAALQVLLGLLNCLVGYRIFRVILVIWGFVAGAAIGWIAGGQAGGPATGLMAALFGGVLLGLAAFAFYIVGVFLLGAVAGAALGAAVSMGAGGAPVPAVVLLLATAGGVLAVLLQKLVIILWTSFGGSAAVVHGVATLAGRGDPLAVLWLYPEQLRSFVADHAAAFFCWLALGVLGVVVQYLWTAPRRKPPVQPAPAPPPLPARKAGR